MSDEIPITPLGRKLIIQRKENLERMIQETQQELAGLAQADPGDGFHDSFFLQTQMNVQMLEQQLREITAQLYNAKLISRPHQKLAIALGHIVTLELNNPYGEREVLTVILFGPAELALIEKHIASEEFPISPNSALGTAILGTKKGESFRYEVDAGAFQGKILNIEIWDKAFSVGVD